MKIYKILVLISVLIIMSGCSQKKKEIVESTSTEHKIETATITEAYTTEATTEEKILQKGSSQNPYKVGEVATIDATNIETNKEVVYELSVDGWEGANLIGNMAIIDAVENTSIRVWGSTMIPYLYRENLMEISDSNTDISSSPNPTVLGYELYMTVGGNGKVYYCPKLYSDADSLSDIKYIVFKYWKYNEGEKIDYYTNFSAECWFEVPQYNE